MRSIEGISHLVIVTPDPAEAAADYARLLGIAPVAVRDGDGQTGRWIEAANVSVLLRTPRDGDTMGLAQLVFRVADLDRARDEAARCGAPSSEPVEMTWSGDAVQHCWREAPFAKATLHGLPVALANRATTGQGVGVALDHIVIRTPNAERAVALYGGRLGLDMRLDRANPAWNARLLFFRCGDLVVEVAHPLAAGVSDGSDTFGGLSWRVPDLAQCHAALARESVDVSELRPGRRPGSHVFSVRDHTAGVPTILLGVTPRAA